MSKIKTIAVLTSGGDAPGMNAAIRSVTRYAIASGMNVYGVKNGYNGLINGNFEELNIHSVNNILHRGGTILGTARCMEFKTHEGRVKAVETCKRYGIEGIVIIGGDGSFKGARELSLLGVPCVGVPATIDNDISCSDYTIGFDTALNTAVEAIDRLRDTSESHNRCSIVEVMGNEAGHLAVNAAIACGATACVVREMGVNAKEYIIDRIERSEDTGTRNFIVIVGEGIADVHQLAKEIQSETGTEMRATILGHIQRGGTPLIRDRVTATRMGVRAVSLLAQGIGNRVVVEQANVIMDFDILEALQMTKTIDLNDIEMNNTISF